MFAIRLAVALLVAVALPLPAPAQPFPPNPVETLTAQACRSLSGFELPELSQVEADWIAGPTPALGAAGGDATDAAELPAHCRVRASIVPGVRFELWLPHPIAWTGRFLGIGRNSLAGGIDHARLRAALVRGYAAAATDGGHATGSYSWLGSDARLRDFGYRAIYEMTAKAQAMTAAYFGRPAAYRYFNGCGLGGREGLMQAQRFAGDYDGIVAGAPVIAVASTLAGQVWAGLQTATASLDRRAIEFVNDQAIAQCDTLDGVLDGIIEDPRRCNFDPGRLQCAAGRTAGCLAPQQVTGLRRLYAGAAPNLVEAPQGPTVVRLPGFAIGSELDWPFVGSASPPAATLEFLTRAVVRDTTWDWRNPDLASVLLLARENVDWMLDADSPDLTDFRANGGKLILYQGWNDGLVPPEATIAYFEAVESSAAGGAGTSAAPARDFARLFMVPGMAHCGGGVGTTEFDAQRSIEDWVERGIGPDRIEAAGPGEAGVARTRPLCAYPEVARYRGSGNSDRSGSFICGF